MKALIKMRAAGLSTDRVALTSVAVCLGILAWAVANAYLGQA
jgi:hypothetical protein